MACCAGLWIFEKEYQSPWSVRKIEVLTKFSQLENRLDIMISIEKMGQCADQYIKRKVFTEGGELWKCRHKSRKKSYGYLCNVIGPNQRR